MLFHNILVAADFSDRSKEAFRIACSLVGGPEAQLTVLHIVEQTFIAEEPVISGQLGIPGLLPILEPAHEVALRERLIEEYVAPFPLNVVYDVCEGDPASEILDNAEESSVDLIVMGTHGRTGLERLLTGSVAENVLRRANCPVLTLRTSPAIASTTTGSPATAKAATLNN